jgi:hypothetical protein
VSEIGYDSALRVAAEIIASRDPADALRLVDRLPVQASTYRAELVRIIAIAMRRSGRGRISDLQSHLSPYIQGYHFLGAIAALERILGSKLESKSSPKIVVVRNAVQDAISTGNQTNLLRVVPLVEALTSNIGEPFGGEVVWASDVRRQLVNALTSFAAEEALWVAMPIADITDFRVIAKTLLVQRPELADPRKIATVLLNAVRKVKRSPLDVFSDLYLALSFALELPQDMRKNFIDRMFAPSAKTSRQAVAWAIDAFERPEDALARVANDKQELQIERIFIPPLAVGEYCRRHPDKTFALLDRLQLSAAELDQPLQQVGAYWPLERWKEGLSAFLDWMSKRCGEVGWTHTTRAFVEVLLRRAAAVEPVLALEEIKRLRDRVKISDPELDYLVETVVVCAAKTRPPQVRHWKFLVNACARISEPGPRTSALCALLLGIEHMAPEERSPPASLAVALMGLGPREPVLNKLETVARAAAAADPGMRAKCSEMVELLRVLLSIPIATPYPTRTA